MKQMKLKKWEEKMEGRNLKYKPNKYKYDFH